MCSSKIFLLLVIGCFHPFQDLVDDCIDALENNGDTVCNIEETVKTHELCYAIEKAMESGTMVRLPLK